MKLYNTFTRHIEEVAVPDDELRIYSCGPTVYDHIHIGNLSSFIFADTLRRAVAFNKTSVKHVMNFTDIDDKTIRRSQEQYPNIDPLDALLKLTTEYSAVFLDDMKAVGNDVEAMTFIKATDSIEAMQDLTRQLHEGGFAYIADDGVYFSIEAYKKSGKTYGQLTEITAGSTSEARIQNDEYDKESAHDFALWKGQKKGEPAWDFNLNGQDLKGRPGWHLECSAMSVAELGQPFDIHTGGVDLIFPHHENEIAQSTAGKDIEYAKVFAHNEHLLVDGQKMSKSLDNFHTLTDIKQRGVDPLAFRLLVLQAHYRNQAHFSWENLEAASTRLQDLKAMAVLRYQVRPPQESESIDFAATSTQLADFLAGDLDTPKALALLSQISTQLQAALIGQTELAGFEAFIKTTDDLLGLGLSTVPNISEAQQELIKQREQARASQDWQQSDALRDQLAEQGIGLRDMPEGSIWFRQ